MRAGRKDERGTLRPSRRAAAFGIASLGLGLMGRTGLAVGPPGKVVWDRGELGDPGSLNPHKATTLIESNILDELFEGLVALNARGEIIPGTAESWTSDQGGTVYNFKLRSGARWSNGDKVVADDFVYAFRRLMRPETGAPYANTNRNRY